MFTSACTGTICYKLQANFYNNHYMCENVTPRWFYSKVNHLLKLKIVFYCNIFIRMSIRICLNITMCAPIVEFQFKQWLEQHWKLILKKWSSFLCLQLLLYVLIHPVIILSLSKASTDGTVLKIDIISCFYSARNFFHSL